MADWRLAAATVASAVFAASILICSAFSSASSVILRASSVSYCTERVDSSVAFVAAA